MSATESSNVTSSEMPHPATTYTVGTITIVTIVLSVLGNGVLLLLWTVRPKTRGHSMIYRYSLIACEIGVALLCLMPLAMNYMARENLVGGMCEVQAYLYSMSFGISTWHIAFLVLNQYVWLSHQDFFAKYQTYYATAMQLFFCWTMPTILLIPGFRNTEVSYHSKRLKCVFSTDTVASIIILDTLLSAALPGVITLTSLVLTFTFLRKQRATIWSQHSITPVTPTEDLERRASSVAVVRFQRTEMPSVVTSTLIFCRLIIGFTINISGNAVQNDIEANGLLVMDCVVYVVVSLDPLFYFVTQERLRSAFGEVVACCGREEDEDGRPGRGRDGDESPSDAIPDLVSEVGIIRGRNRAFSMAGATHGVRPSFY